ncbi:MAG: ATP-dependent Clp protease proteolytic subunit [Akkermansia sp.]|nr:ATP-dependent Clp protease proteolytic subunit [Akkermansia sp.]
MPKKKDKQKPFKADLTMAGESATLDVTGFIGWDTEPIQFTDLVAQAKQAGCTHLTVRINSLGGYCYDGLAIGDCLRDCGMATTAVVLGTAQSMASYILQCCQVREAHRGATIMFHQPSAGVCGTVDEIMEQAQYLCSLRDRMFADMAARCGITGPELSAEHMTMKIYTAEEALAKGFIDRISGAADVTETEPETAPEPQPEPVQNACKVYEYDRVQMAMAMAAEEEAEPETELETEPDPSPADASAEAGTEPAAAPEELRRDKPETEPETEPATDAGIAKMVADEVQRQLAIREAQMLAEMGAPVSALPAAAAGGSCGVASRASFSMAELDAMPAMQRIEVLQQDSALAAAYAAHI